MTAIDHSLTVIRAREILQRAAGASIVVIGDLMLDEFWQGLVSRISPEAPVPVVQVTDDDFRLGGAANVAHNVRRLGGQPVLFGVAGDDAAGRRLQEALDRAGIDSGGVVADRSRPTTTKLRVIAHQQQIVRADREATADLPPPIEQALIDRARVACRQARAVILSDYCKGVVTAELARAVVAAARVAQLPVLVDPKVSHMARYRGATLVTPNQHEALQAAHIPVQDPHASADEAVRRAGLALLAEFEADAVLITRGAHGMMLFERQRDPRPLPTRAREVADVTGAGDTVIAALALGLAGGASFHEAAQLANVAAGVVVAKLGTATLTPDELLAAI